jgi:hypothetical protein
VCVCVWGGVGGGTVLAGVRNDVGADSLCCLPSPVPVRDHQGNTWELPCPTCRRVTSVSDGSPRQAVKSLPTNWALVGIAAIRWETS